VGVTDKIEPALTAEEWADARKRGPLIALSDLSGEDQVGDPVPFLVDDLPYIIALANAALSDDDPAKITREKLDAVYAAVVFAVAQMHEAHGRDVATPAERRALALAAAFSDALESYLPPLGREFYVGGLTYVGGNRDGKPVNLAVGELMPAEMEFPDCPGGRYVWRDAAYAWEPSPTPA